ncbi:FAD:protein FMN transferase [Clostridium septicum]|uniref:FAD:protein FMN transferase n=1 Tax=Clostridium septicum TaxID=1504 RepID=A0A9N7JP76_CLOSE|nr:FAD:protein FMN transferase [Clostridium septicum]AYE35854.1 FAD:protein FMN transferase [Clostridium septicum]MDU1312790.1 FAD:protein FMN transferase [Clostridium septicum]QAS62161.1 FAD:protein FMN transferase [Clostridium septicum]UEC22341.1 FAD:protein FMN transferase [Clostridium septicum]USS02422.1 FAD:protein FMN transferase [Clostridium septicum]
MSLSILIVFTLLSITGCSKKTSSPISRSEILMGTIIKVTIFDSSNEKVLDEVFNKIKELESTLSINANGTLIDKINESAGVAPVKVDDDTYNLISKGIEYSNLSNGLFDISIGPLVKLWSIGLPEAKVPSKEEINEKLPLIDFNNIELNDTNKTIFLKKSGMLLDLGGIAKGYTADKISDILAENNIKNALIDLGGNIYTHGTKITGDDWKVGIQDPFSERGEIIGSITISNKSIVTSGIYERFIEKDGIKYHHILSPETGYPYDNDLAGITIISNKSIDGDALSTSVFAMGLKDGINFVEKLENIEAIFVTKDKRVHITSGLKDNFVITNESFVLE